ncbi:MAG: 2-hydroxyacyl-CoA dehydratase [Chloroflexi bacterium]|nr:2-hydroxyacyl-CoA dehydratase [Chloroflexota bacterium]
MTVKRWETRPLGFWDKAKEMRQKHDKAVVHAAERHELLCESTGLAYWTMAFPAVRMVSENPQGSMLSFLSDKFARQCRLASEVRGWGREMCGYKLNVYGSMYLDHDISGKDKFPRRDMVVPAPAPCNLHSKRAQGFMDYSPIPRWSSDAPDYTDPPDPERDKVMINNVVGCILDQIEDIERIFGQKFDDEKLIQVLKDKWTYQKLAGESVCLMQNVPSPLSIKDLYSLYTIGGLTKTDPTETVQLWTMIRDELKWRVENQIAAVGTERYRWVESEPPPWHFLKYYRYMEKYGAVCIGSSYTHGIGGPYEWRADGTWGPSPTPLDLGVPLNTREDAIRALVGAKTRASHGIGKFAGVWDLAKAFKVQGAILPLWRAGVGCVVGHREAGLVLRDMGVNVMHYEGDQPGDRTDMDENHMLDQLDVWMESQGLRKVED